MFPRTLLLLLACVAPAEARIVRLEIKPTLPESSARVPDSYHVVQGLAHGELDPHDAHNAIIQDLQLAPVNSRGMVEYTATFTLYAPIHPAADAVLFYDVVNRGGAAMPRDYSSGDFFLVSGWQADIPFQGRSANGTHAETIQVPTARATGPAVARFLDLPPNTRVLTLARSTTYAANDLPPAPDMGTPAHLFTKQSESQDGKVTGLAELPREDWSWSNCEGPSTTQICLKKPADPALLYELRFTARDPLVMGIGLAAIRDLNTYIRAAYGVKTFIATGVSQSGNLLRSFLNLGFNQDETGHQVFEGVMPIISARQVPLNVRFGVPGGTSMLFELGTDGANWYAPTPDPIRHQPTSGELDRCSATKTCPKIIEILGSAEFYSLRASMGFVGPEATHDLPLPANVRRFYVAGTTHGGGPGGFRVEAVSTPSNCVLAANPNPENPIRRALLLALKLWARDNTPPPDSVYPTLAAHTLASAASVLAAGTPFNPNLFYDLGPHFTPNDESGVPAQTPAPVVGVAPAVLPVVNADGNEIGGVQTPLLQAPLGTYTGWNNVASGFRKGQFCSLTGGYKPFARTRAEQAAAHDPRPSIEERYPSHQAYVDRVRGAAEGLVHQRLLLEDDAAAMIQQAESSDVGR